MVDMAIMQSSLNPVFMRYGIKKAVLFGSFAKGTDTENSDIDILVESGLHGLKFLGLLEDVKEAVGREVDLLDISHIEKGSLVESEILKTGKEIQK